MRWRQGPGATAAKNTTPKRSDGAQSRRDGESCSPDCGQQAADQMCGLSSYQVDFSKDQLTKLYGDKKTYKSKVEKRLKELEKAGWSMPIYHDMIMSDVAKVDF